MRVDTYIAERTRYATNEQDRGLDLAIEDLFLTAELVLDVNAGIDLNIYDGEITKEDIEYDDEDRVFELYFEVTHPSLPETLRLHRVGSSWFDDHWDIKRSEESVKLGQEELMDQDI